MAQTIELTASILAANPLHLHADINQLAKLGVQSLHIDVMDHHYVDNLAINFDTISAIANTFPELNLDVHLMVNNTDQAIARLQQIQPRMISFHPCTSTNPQQTVKKIQAFSNASIAINPTDSIPSILELIAHADHCLIMSVEPGKCGQSFQEGALNNLRTIHDDIGDKIQFGIDGGINTQTLAKVLAQNIPIAEAVVGSALFAKRQISSNYQNLLNTICEHTPVEVNN